MHHLYLRQMLSMLGCCRGWGLCYFPFPLRLLKTRAINSCLLSNVIVDANIYTIMRRRLFNKPFKIAYIFKKKKDRELRPDWLRNLRGPVEQPSNEIDRQSFEKCRKIIADHSHYKLDFVRRQVDWVCHGSLVRASILVWPLCVCLCLWVFLL